MRHRLRAAAVLALAAVGLTAAAETHDRYRFLYAFGRGCW